MTCYVGKFLKTGIRLLKEQSVLKDSLFHLLPSVDVQSSTQYLHDLSFLVCFEDNFPHKEPSPFAFTIFHSTLVLHHRVDLLKVLLTFFPGRKQVIVLGVVKVFCYGFFPVDDLIGKVSQDKKD